MGERLQEATGTTAAQIELNKKREYELTKLRKDLEEANIQQDGTVASMKKKQHDAIAEMTEQIDQLTKMRAKYALISNIIYIKFLVNILEVKTELIGG